ncbi:homeobox protein 2-like [Trichoplusia ni]|uniref:Homeobox protein 2-like n=1 Tax=Trichoplusia ni TaxID=7111 RepID=A0A7E5W8A1_TRINI|nr:homeobox protein 2-like [Trichoplusia ni]
MYQLVPESESTKYHPRFSGSVEDNMNGFPNHLSPLGYHNKNSISHPNHYGDSKSLHTVTKYDENRVKGAKTMRPEDPFMGSTRSPLLNIAQYEKNKEHSIHDPHGPHSSPSKLSPYNSLNPSFKTTQYGMNKLPAYESPYDSLSLTESPEKDFQKKSLHETHGAFTTYNPHAHHDSQLSGSPHNSQKISFNTVPYDQNKAHENLKIPATYNPYINYSSQLNVSPYELQKYGLSKTTVNFNPYSLNMTHTVASEKPHHSSYSTPDYDSQKISASYYSPSSKIPRDPHTENNMKNKLPANEQANVYETKHRETLLNSLNNPHATLTSIKHDNGNSPRNKHLDRYSDNHSYPHYENDFNSFDHDQQNHSTRPEIESLDGHGSDNRPHYTLNSIEDPNTRNKPNKYGSNVQHQSDKNFDDRGSLDGFQYKYTSDEEFEVKKADLNEHQPTQGFSDENQYLSVIPHKSKYQSYSLYQKPTTVSQASITKSISQNQSQKPKTYQNVVDETPFTSKNDVFDDRGAHEGFQYKSNYDDDDDDDKNNSDHSDNWKPSNYDSKTVTFDVNTIDPTILKILENTNKPLSIEDLIQEIDGHKTTQSDHNDPTVLNNDNDELQNRFNDDAPDLPSYHKEQTFKKIPLTPPIDDSGFTIGDLNPFVLLRLLFPSGFDKNIPNKNNDQITDSINQTDLLALLLSTQNIYNKNNKTNNKIPSKTVKFENLVKYIDAPLGSPKMSIQEENDPVNKLHSRNDMTNGNEFSSAPYKPKHGSYKPPNYSPPYNKEKKVSDHPVSMQPALAHKEDVNNNQALPLQPYQEATQHPNQEQHPNEVQDNEQDQNEDEEQNHDQDQNHEHDQNHGQDQPQNKHVAIISDESKNFPPLQYPEVHIILHQQKEEDNDDVMSYFPSLMNQRIKKGKEQKAECGEDTHWTRNCHACVCRGGEASCVQIPDCVQRSLEEPMMCKPYSTFKMGSCYSCECNGDGIPECNAAECKIEPKAEESEEDSGEIKHTVYHEFYEEDKAKDMLSYYKFFKKLPKETYDDYPTCEPGTQWVSSCHDCECNEKYKHECTVLDGCKVDLEALGKPGKCKPNSKFYPKSTNVACQECSCDDEGNPSCPLIEPKDE